MSTSNYAGFWKRVGAYIIDTIVFMIPYYIFLFVFMGSAYTDPEAMEMAMEGEGTFGSMGLFMIGFTILYFLYFAYFESSESQATLGKRALKIKVTDTNGGRISFMHALGRNLAKILSSLVLLIGYIMAGFTEKKQGLHDMIAGTLVVSTTEKEDLNVG